MSMNIDERFNRIASVGEEIISTEDLKALIASGKPLVAYDGFEPSGKLHIAQGLLRVITINKLTSAGVKFKLLVADWHGWANNKMGGDLEKIKTVGKYFIEVWKACGLDEKNVEFVWVSDMVKDDNYWKLVMRVARLNTLKRIIRCSQIMGRAESDDLSAAQILYPCMQCADIFYLGANICQLGMDQRKVNMLAREIAPDLGVDKPICLHHHMLMGLTPPKSDVEGIDRKIALKMSKSNPASAIFMTDEPSVVDDKFAKAYCPAGQVNENPVLEYFKYIIFEKFPSISINRPEKFGGDVTFTSYADLEAAFGAGKVHPLDLKKSCAACINTLLAPIQRHFQENADAKSLKELIDSYQVTR